MPLLVGQLIYTSFPGAGFKCLVSAQISLEIQQAFIQQIVHQRWDAYNPPKIGYRAVYLYQLSSEQSLFGWLYNEGIDDVGRSNIPYFVGYYLAGRLDKAQLDNILTCLITGPVHLIDRQQAPKTLESITIPDSCLYQPAHLGVDIAPEILQQNYRDLQQKKLLNLFVAVEEMPKIVQPSLANNNFNVNKLPPLPLPVEPGQFIRQPKRLNKIEGTSLERILEELAAKPIGIQGVVLVSREGKPITTPIGIDENSVLVISGMMLYLANSTRDEFNWQEIENISVRSQQGYVLLTCCSEDVFLLVKTGKVLAGLLEGEINRTVKKLQIALQEIEATVLQAPILPKLTRSALPKVDEVFYELQEELASNPENQVKKGFNF